jgi:outer membrane receptor for Fe3+-dicitrate
VLAYYVDSFRGSYIEQESGSQRRLTAAPRNYNYLGLEPRYSRIFETGSVVQEVSVGYRYLKEKSSEVALRTAYYTPGTEGNAMDLPMNATRTAMAAPRRMPSISTTASISATGPSRPACASSASAPSTTWKTWARAVW